jgi:Mg2+-importing ATPase
MTLKGLIIFKDPLKKDVAQTIKKLRDQKVRVKMITGDQYQVALHVAQQLGLRTDLFLLGQDLEGLSDEGLEEKVYDVDVFAEMTPLQKEKIILALRRKGFVVGYLGDGINDVAALHASDVGLAVNSGSDVAKERADIVLLKKELMVVSQGIEQGRKTFANTMKYIFMASSANFGNMFSMAGASLFLPFLPLLPKQILLANLLTDLPEMTIATDSVDIEWYEKPADWDMKRIRRFMLMFGFISSVFDYLTFAVLLYFLKADPALFRTGWFLESVASASMIVLMIRTRRPFWKSRPSSFLVAATIISVTIAAALPLLPFKSLFSFVPLPGTYYTALLSILILYGCATELTKKIFYSKSG